MKKLIRAAGYHGYSMSNNAVAAYADGEMPISKWTKSAIISQMEDLGLDPAIISEAKKLPLSSLKRVALAQSSWHHTSKMYNRTNFYSVNPYITLQALQNAIDTPKAPVKSNGYKYCEVSYGEWEGSRRHPKLKTYTGYAIVQGNWAYVYDGFSVIRKKVDGTHFEIIAEFDDIPADAKETFYSIKQYMNKSR